MRRGKASPDDGYLSRRLDEICPLYASRYQEMITALSEKAGDGEDAPDALDVLACLVMEALGISIGDADLSAARAYLSILIDNEHLPAQAQLNENELATLRELLFCYFSGDESANDKGSEVLALIERKFASDQFSQARILLQIFETNNETRQNNERNLYYEEMILRLEGTSARAHAISSETAEIAMKPSADDDDVTRAFSELDQTGNVRFYLYLREPADVERWRESLSSLDESVRGYLLDYIPVIRWRKIGSPDIPIQTQIGLHMTFEMFRRYVQQKLRMCYFILLANGNTEYEWFIFSFSKWSREHFDVNVCDVFPMIHRSGILDGMCLQEALDIAIDQFYARRMNEISITSDQLSKAYREVLKQIFGSDLSQIPAGNYNFGDFLLDWILPFDYKNPMFAFQLHLMM
ncbi:MAG: hypothetical protein IJU23_07560 [Proteobacteria bacterium]|nr:hypothetical protein [Pseudomonadota bacterium]